MGRPGVGGARAHPTPPLDPPLATDLRLVLALLAARDGRPDDALRLYEEAARDSPFDARPRALAFHACCLSGRDDEAGRWSDAYRRLVPESEIVDPVFLGYETTDLTDLVHELVVAASLGGVCDLERPFVRVFLLRRVRYELDVRLATALQDKTLSMAERLQLRALRVYLHAKVVLLEKTLTNDDDNDDDDDDVVAEPSTAS